MRYGRCRRRRSAGIAVQGEDVEAVRDRRRCYPEVVGVDRSTALGQLGAGRRVGPADGHEHRAATRDSTSEKPMLAAVAVSFRSQLRDGELIGLIRFDRSKGSSPRRRHVDHLPVGKGVRIRNDVPHDATLREKLPCTARPRAATPFLLRLRRVSVLTLLRLRESGGDRRSGHEF